MSRARLSFIVNLEGPHVAEVSSEDIAETLLAALALRETMVCAVLLSKDDQRVDAEPYVASEAFQRATPTKGNELT